MFSLLRIIVQAILFHRDIAISTEERKTIRNKNYTFREKKKKNRETYDFTVNMYRN